MKSEDNDIREYWWDDLSRDIISGACPACASGIHSDCYSPPTEGNPCCCPAKTSGGEVELDSGADRIGVGEVEQKPSTIERIKAASEVTDVQSTGRKRAALAYPIEEGMICEWANLRGAGGGVVPIVGCAGRVATDRHHGPDKNTLNNTEGNVHRICTDCHNRWHALNDAFYGKRPGGSDPFIPLDGNTWTEHSTVAKASAELIVASEVWWAIPKHKRTEPYSSIFKEKTSE